MSIQIEHSIDWPQPETEPVEPASASNLSRREFLERLRSVGLVVGGTAVAAQYGWMAHTIRHESAAIGQAEDKLWPETPVSLTFLNNEPYGGQPEITIYLPGFGDMHSLEEAKTWKVTSRLQQRTPVAAVDYSNQGTTITGIANTIREQTDARLQRINFVCRSIGGLYVLPLIAELDRLASQAPDTGLAADFSVNSILFMSSPSRLSNGDFGSLGQWAAHIPENRGIATLFKFIYNYIRSTRDDGFDVPSNAASGWQATMSGANPLALQREMQTASNINIFNPALQRTVSHRLAPGSRFVYTATDRPYSDQTVMVGPSSRDFKRAFKQMGRQLAVIGLPYPGHANVEVTAHHMRSWTETMLQPTVLAAK